MRSCRPFGRGVGFLLRQRFGARCGPLGHGLEPLNLGELVAPDLPHDVAERLLGRREHVLLNVLAVGGRGLELLPDPFRVRLARALKSNNDTLVLRQGRLREFHELRHLHRGDERPEEPQVAAPELRVVALARVLVDLLEPRELL